ncbi:hypothetical protein C8F01DRAFT_1088339 [Mycena amicta]|nr:hypothetical protein C8F01DRAFT_1088339 [Mycena amicta]
MSNGYGFGRLWSRASRSRTVATLDQRSTKHSSRDSCEHHLPSSDGKVWERKSNLCLAGFESLSLFDPELVAIEDLGSQFLLREENVRVKSRAEASAPRLARLWQAEEVEILPALSLEAVKAFELEINTWTRDNGVYLVSTEARGLFGSVISPSWLNNSFPYAARSSSTSAIPNSTGEEAKTGRILSNATRRPASTRAGRMRTAENLSIDQGSTLSPSTISPPGMGAYASDSAQGVFTENRPRYSHQTHTQKPYLEHKSFIAAFGLSHNSEHKAPTDICLECETTSMPHESFLSSIAGSNYPPIDSETSNHIITEMAYQVRGSVPPFNALLGALAAQQAIAACAKRFTPLHSGIGQLFYPDALDCLPSPPSLPTEADCAPHDEGSRYDGQIAVFGRQFVEKKVMCSRQMLVGAGAVGTEVLVNWALMGQPLPTTHSAHPTHHLRRPPHPHRHVLLLGERPVNLAEGASNGAIIQYRTATAFGIHHCCVEFGDEFTSKAKSEQRMSLRFRELFQLASKKAIPPHAKLLQVEVMVEDESGEDVDGRLGTWVLGDLCPTFPTTSRRPRPPPSPAHRLGHHHRCPSSTSHLVTVHRRISAHHHPPSPPSLLIITIIIITALPARRPPSMPDAPVTMTAQRTEGEMKEIENYP